MPLHLYILTGASRGMGLAMAPRLLLHACALAFAHPMGGQPCRFTLPEEFGKNGL